MWDDHRARPGPHDPPLPCRSLLASHALNLPLTIVIVLVAVAVSVGLFLVIRRFSPPGGFFNDGDRAAGVFGVLATGFSVLLGFVVFLAFTTYGTALSGAQSEASDVIQQYQTAQLLPSRKRRCSPAS